MVAAESFLNVVPRWGFGLMVLPMGSCSCGAGEKQVSAPEKSTVPLMPQWPGRPCAMPSPEVYPMAWTAGTFYCCDAALHPKLLKNNNFSSTESPNQATNNCNESTPCTNTTPPSFCPLVPSRCPLSGRAAHPSPLSGSCTEPPTPCCRARAGPWGSLPHGTGLWGPGRVLPAGRKLR